MSELRLVLIVGCDVCWLRYSAERYPREIPCLKVVKKALAAMSFFLEWGNSVGVCQGIVIVVGRTWLMMLLNRGEIFCLFSQLEGTKIVDAVCGEHHIVAVASTGAV